MDHIKELKEFLKEAREEFKKALKEENRILMRDACEKAWGSAYECALSKEGVSPLPRSYRERRIRE